MQTDNTQLIHDCTVGKRTVIRNFVNLYGCKIGDDCMIGTFVEIQKDTLIGNKVRIQSHSFVCAGTVIGDEVFIGHHVVFINDNHPRAVNKKGDPITTADWKMSPVIVRTGATVGSNATILGGVTVGAYAVVGAGAVVTKNVPSGTIVAGNPAKVIGKVRKKDYYAHA